MRLFCCVRYALAQLEASLTRVHGGAPKFASGHAEATWNRNPGGADTLDVTVSYNGISSAVCGVHVHQGAAFGDCSTATPLSLDLISGNWTGEVTLGPGALSPGGTLAGEITVGPSVFDDAVKFVGTRLRDHVDQATLETGAQH